MSRTENAGSSRRWPGTKWVIGRRCSRFLRGPAQEQEVLAPCRPHVLAAQGVYHRHCRYGPGRSKAFIAAQSLDLGGVYIGGIRNDLAKVQRNLAPAGAGLSRFRYVPTPGREPGQKNRLPHDVVCKTDQYDDSGDSC